MDKSEDFVLVNNKRKRHRRRQDRLNKSIDKLVEVDVECSVDYGRIRRKIEDFVQELKHSEFYKNLLESALLSYSKIPRKKPDHEVAADAADVLARMTLSDMTSDLQFVCYGVGHVASCVIAQYQLALCLALRDDMKLMPNCCLMYDPIFTEKEESFLKDLKFELLAVNEEGKRSCTEPTLFFLPHCGKPLYNNLLWSNWRPDKLSNIILIGNSFSSIIERTPQRILNHTGSYIVKISPFTDETPLGNFHYSDVFNDMSIHTFPDHKLTSVPRQCWEVCPEPRYHDDDPEIILSTPTSCQSPGD